MFNCLFRAKFTILTIFEHKTRLCSCFSRYTRFFLGIKLHGLENNIERQAEVLKEFNILPLILRLYKHYCKFVYNLFTQRRAPYLISLYTPATDTHNLRSKFRNPKNKTNSGVESFVNISTHLLNQFINDFLVLPVASYKNELKIKNLQLRYSKSCLFIT